MMWKKNKRCLLGRWLTIINLPHRPKKMVYDEIIELKKRVQLLVYEQQLHPVFFVSASVNAAVY
ncbi:hypothetical protein IGI86_002920 [Enterococcus sp. AZ188]